jgi:hypothetical protein
LTVDNQTLGGGLPGGLCTLKCSADADCTALSSNSFCLPVDATSGYCLEGCTLGQAGSPKCHERSDFVCTVVGVIDTKATCTQNSDCGAQQICDSQGNVCADTVTGCAPGCRGDFDCSSSEYCDFSSGTCLPGKPTGLALGASCDPTATPDPCDGFCSAIDSTGKTGACTGVCSLTPDATGCGWSGTGTANAACVFATPFSPTNDFALGDVGLCGALCDCNNDCKVDTERCVDDTMGVISKVWGRAGYCRPLLTTETEANSIACK